MGKMRDFVSSLDKFEESDEFKKFSKEGDLWSSSFVSTALMFVMKDLRGSGDPKQISKWILLEYQI